MLYKGSSCPVLMIWVCMIRNDPGNAWVCPGLQVPMLFHPSYIRWSLVYIYRVIHTIMGPPYVHRLLWGLTLVHKVVPIYIYMYSHSYYYGSIHLMYTDYCGVLLLYIRWCRQWRFQSGQVTRADDTRGAHGRLMGGENPAPPPNCRALDCLTYGLTVGELCP